jgi:hypothetical protein
MTKLLPDPRLDEHLKSKLIVAHAPLACGVVRMNNGVIQSLQTESNSIKKRKENIDLNMS